MGKKIKLIEPTKGHISKAERLDREAMREELFEYPDLNTQPPTFLTGEALNEWNRVVPLLKSDIPISELDYSLIVSYCVAVGTIIECQNHIKDNGAMLKDGKSNPAVRLQSQAMKDMRMLANSLGMSLDSRMKLAFNKSKEKPKDAFESLMLDD
ncbi:phage terminase small subunit P27 family [Lysinibacillus sp. FSL W8-0992]|uniref:phage terminase small subunit P27 family n=1 Tax=Lysinibacillus sp. FSL W8-0992 TaxID=2954643 RepID=UPI0030FAE159